MRTQQPLTPQQLSSRRHSSALGLMVASMYGIFAPTLIGGLILGTKGHPILGGGLVAAGTFATTMLSSHGHIYADYRAQGHTRRTSLKAAVKDMFNVVSAVTPQKTARKRSTLAIAIGGSLLAGAMVTAFGPTGQVKPTPSTPKTATSYPIHDIN